MYSFARLRCGTHAARRENELMGTVHGGRLVARALSAERVPFIFTLCGGHVMPIYDGCLDEGIGVILSLIHI